MLVHWFGVFEFKFAFEFICLLLFKNRKPIFFSSLSPYPFPSSISFGPSQESPPPPLLFLLRKHLSSARAA
jgi:hypothetical protein